MVDLSIRNLSNKVYNYAMNKDMTNAKESYKQLLEHVSKNPTVSVESLLNECTTDLYTAAKKEALEVTGSSLSIKTAVDNNRKALDNIAILNKDKEIKPILKSLKKTTKQDNGIILLLKEQSSKLFVILKKLAKK